MGGTASILGIPFRTRRNDDVVNSISTQANSLSNSQISPVSASSADGDGGGTTVNQQQQSTAMEPVDDPSPSPQVDSPQIATPVPVAMLVTPRRQENMLNCVPSTPQGDALSKYPYYCPLCMEHFQDILEAPCCGNYTCLPCCMTYIQSRGIIANDVNEMLAKKSEMGGIACPHCNTDGFKPDVVALDNKKIRDYSMGVPAGQTATNPNGYSPLKIGESFENMKRKMIPLIQATATTAAGNPTNYIQPSVGMARDSLNQSGGGAAGIAFLTTTAFSTTNSVHEVASSLRSTPVVLLPPVSALSQRNGDNNSNSDARAEIDPADDNGSSHLRAGNLSPTRLHYGEASSQPGSLHATPRSPCTAVMTTTLSVKVTAAEYVNSILLTAVTGSNQCSRLVEVLNQ